MKGTKTKQMKAISVAVIKFLYNSLSSFLWSQVLIEILDSILEERPDGKIDGKGLISFLDGFDSLEAVAAIAHVKFLH
jgi:uncharacterized protein with PQ loop repeat